MHLPDIERSRIDKINETSRHSKTKGNVKQFADSESHIWGRVGRGIWWGEMELLKSLFQKFPTAARSEFLLLLANFRRPLWLGIEVTRRCNLKCEMCMRKHGRFPGPYQLDMPLERLKLILRNFRSVKNIIFTGPNEPLLHPKFSEILREIRKTGKRISLTTNGTLLDRSWATKLIELGVAEVRVSIDGATSPTYEKIRRGSNFAQVIKNLERLVRTKQRYGAKYPRIGINFVGLKTNLVEFPEIVRMAIKLGLDSVALLHPLPFSKRIERQHPHRFPKLLAEVEDNAKRIASGHPIRLVLPPLKLKPMYCIAPWHMPSVTIEGMLKSCSPGVGPPKTFARAWYMGVSVAATAEIFDLGDLTRQSYDQIWREEKYAFLRKWLIDRIHKDMREKWDLSKYQELVKKTKTPYELTEFCKVCPFRFSVATC